MCWREEYSSKIFYEFKGIQKMCQNAKNTLVK